jgi:hypothetical protein
MGAHRTPNDYLGQPRFAGILQFFAEWSHLNSARKKNDLSGLSPVGIFAEPDV